MKDQLDNAISASLAVGRDNGVTALRHDTPISVSQVEDEVMAGRSVELANVEGRTRAITSRENDRGPAVMHARAGRRK